MKFEALFFEDVGGIEKLDVTLESREQCRARERGRKDSVNNLGTVIKGTEAVSRQPSRVFNASNEPPLGELRDSSNDDQSSYLCCNF